MFNVFELTQKDPKTLQERSLKLSEEVGELSQAVLSATNAPGSAYKNLNLDHVREEAVDCVIVARSVLAQVSDDEAMFKAEFEKLMQEKCIKWQATLSKQEI